MKQFVFLLLVIVFFVVFVLCFVVVVDQVLGEVIVIVICEGQLVVEMLVLIGVIKDKLLCEVCLIYFFEIMGQVFGVWVNVIGGEGYQMVICQFLIISLVYFYLEDGILMWLIGFFNYNVLYEVNLLMVGGIEVNKGLGSVFYGFDVIGGVINVLICWLLIGLEIEVLFEVGFYGWWCVMFIGGNVFGNYVVWVDFNFMYIDGWCDYIVYDC